MVRLTVTRISIVNEVIGLDVIQETQKKCKEKEERGGKGNQGEKKVGTKMKQKNSTKKMEKRALRRF